MWSVKPKICNGDLKLYAKFKCSRVLNLPQKHKHLIELHLVNVKVLRFCSAVDMKMNAVICLIFLATLYVISGQYNITV